MPGGSRTCLELCSLDEECPWGHKCCSNGCGHVCTQVSSDKEAYGHHKEASIRGNTRSCRVPADLYADTALSILSILPAQHHCEARSHCCPIALLPADAFAGQGDLK